MARTWFAGSATRPADPPSRATVPNASYDPAPSIQRVSSRNQLAVHDSATAHTTTPTKKATHFDFVSEAPVTWTTPSTSSQKEQSTQPPKEPFDASAILTKLIEQHSKPKELQTAANFKSQDPRLFKTAAMMDAIAPSLSAPHRAPVAQMMPRPSNTAATTPPAERMTMLDAWTTSLSGPGQSTMGASTSQAFFPAAASASPSLITSLPILPSQPAATPKKRPQQTSTPKVTPKITITPAPATAPSAFKDAALASHVQNTKLLSPPTKQQANGVKKRQYIKKNPSPPKASSTPGSVPGEKRKVGRPRKIRIEEPPPQPTSQHRPLPEPPNTPLPAPDNPPQSSPPPSTVSTVPPQQQQNPAPTPQQQQNPTPTPTPPSRPTVCSEEPRLWPNRDDYVAHLLRWATKPETTHSTPLHRCTNTAHPRHRPDPQKPPRDHGVCTACRHCAHRHLRATRPDLLLGSAWWPLCKTCSARETPRLDRTKNKKKKKNKNDDNDNNDTGCKCHDAWLCFPCFVEAVEKRSAMNEAEAEGRRRILVGGKLYTLDGEDETVMTGWACECGEEVGSERTNLLKCLGCKEVRVGKLDPQDKAAREKKFRKKALAVA